MAVPALGHVGPPAALPVHLDEHTLVETVVAAAQELFVAEGSEALTHARLHKATRISQGAIFACWPDKASLVAELLRRATVKPAEVAPTDDLIHDLREAMKLLVGRFEGAPVRQFFAACIEFGMHSAEVSAVGHAYIDGLLQPFQDIIGAAVRRGELEGDVDHLVADLTGGLMLRYVLRGENVTRRDAVRAVAAFMGRHRAVPES